MATNPYENPKNPVQAAAKRRMGERGPAPEYDTDQGPGDEPGKLWPKPTPEHPYDFAHPIEDGQE